MNKNLHYFKALNSLNGSRKIIPSENLLTKLEDAAISFVHKNRNAQKKYLMMIAASLVMLFSLNFSAIIMINSTKIFCFEGSNEKAEANELIPVKSIYHE